METIDAPPVQRARALFDDLDRMGASAASGESEPAGSFDRAALEAVVAAGLYGVAVPKDVGGIDLPLTEAVRVWAELARADGSIGWCAFASDSALAYFTAYLPDEGIERLLAESPGGRLPFAGGQFAPNGTAVQDGDAWVVDGDYQFGSGILLAELAGAGFFATPDSGGDAMYLMGSFPVAEIEPRGNWDVLGLRATQSIDYGVHGVRLAMDCAFDFFAPTVHRGSAKHFLGVIPLTAAGHAAWAMGVARRMLDELVALAPTKARMGAAGTLADSEHFQIELARLESRHRAGWAWVMETCERAEAECEERGDFVSVPTANLLRQACVHVNRESVRIAQEAYALAGTTALREGPMQRCVRDLMAGAQHYFASDSPTIDFAHTLLGGGA
jgi:alkylation response protein AidB-like acyl-CoA dehydrogenase